MLVRGLTRVGIVLVAGLFPRLHGQQLDVGNDDALALERHQRRQDVIEGQLQRVATGL